MASCGCKNNMYYDSIVILTPDDFVWSPSPSSFFVLLAEHLAFGQLML